MSVSLEYLERCAAETGFSAGTLEKVTRLGELAAAIASHPLLKNTLALKGGTAFNLCFGSAPNRLSVDLDYNYVAYAEREAMLADRPHIEEAIAALTQRLGFRIQQSADSFAGRKLFAAYRSVLGPESRIELDLNYLWRAPLDGTAARELWQPGGLDRPRVLTVSALELCVGKFLAFLDRSAPRDAWDVVRIPALTDETLRAPLFRPLFIALSATLPHALSDYNRGHIERRLTDRMIQEQLVPMLTAGTVQEEETLISRAWQVVERFTKLASHEQEYVVQIKNGVARTELLFPDDPVLSARIAGHPAILWKVNNVLKHRR